MARQAPAGSRDQDWRGRTRRDARHGDFRLYPSWRTMRETMMCSGPGCKNGIDDDPWTATVEHEGEVYEVGFCSEACANNWHVVLAAEWNREPERRRRRRFW